MDALLLAKCLVSAFFAVLFLQSGTDKFIDWRGNQTYLDDHFTNTPLHHFVTPLLAIIMATEVLTGILCAGSALIVLLGGNDTVPVLAMTASCISLLMLFTGQRLAKDYAGAQTLATYFVVALVGLILMWPGWLVLPTLAQ